MMFWRILRRLLRANPARMATILLALGAGAGVTSALLNLKVDAERRLTTEFRAFGANVIVAPRDTISATAGPSTLDEVTTNLLPGVSGGNRVAAIAFLYLIADAASSSGNVRAVVAGRSGAGPDCEIGTRVASELKLRLEDRLVLQNAGREEQCRIVALLSNGGPEDSQIFVKLDAAQRLAALPGRISLVQLSVAGTPAVIEDYISALAKALPNASVRGIRQFTEAEAKIHDRIRGLLTATVALILVLTALCVSAAMTSAAMERKHDVGLMKAIGGPADRILRLFLAEAALLGVAGGILGAAAGIGLSIWLGKAVFGIAARPRLIVYPVTVVLTILVAIAGAFPLRRLASVKPAVIFRGEA